MIVPKAARVTAYQPSFDDSRRNTRPQKVDMKSARYETAPNSFLEQAEVCREQARDAANLKRFHAALGLFATAATLCRHAVTLEHDAVATRSIQERLRQIELEATTYYELARSRESSHSGF